jgi:ketosteroid isomerase-like protein
MRADQQTGAAAMAVLNQFSEAYLKRDLEGLLSLFAPDADVVLIGTGRDERRVGQPEIQVQAERDWAQTEAGSLKWTWHSVSAAGSVAWVAAEGIFEAKVGGEDLSLPVRLTGVLEKRGDQWLIVQFHTSFPADQTFPASVSHLAHASTVR